MHGQTGEKKAIVSPISGTTRDAVDTQLIGPDGSKITLVDTAGIRRRTAVKESPDGAEPLSVSRAIKAMRRCDVCPSIPLPQASWVLRRWSSARPVVSARANRGLLRFRQPDSLLLACPEHGSRLRLPLPCTLVYDQLHRMQGPHEAYVS